MPHDVLTDRLDALARVDPMPAPLLSLYLNTDVNENGRPTYHAFLRNEVRDHVARFADRTAARESLERDMKRIARFMVDGLERSTRGLALFACAATELFEAIQMDVPFDQNVVAIGDRPHLYPLAKLDDEYRRAAALVADTNLARIYVFSAGRTAALHEIQSSKTRHSKGGGWSQARIQRHVENAHARHAKEVAERLDAIVNAEDVDDVLVAGDRVIIPLLRRYFSETLETKIVDVRPLDIRTPEDEVRDATLDAVQRHDRLMDRMAVWELVDEYRAGRRALIGPRDVLGALRRGQVQTLLIAAAPDRVAGADARANELVLLAKRTSASLRFIEDPSLLAPAGGAAAWLRYPLEGRMSRDIDVRPQDGADRTGRRRKGFS